MSIQSDPAALADLPLFRDLPPEALARLAGAWRPSRVPTGATLMTAEAPGELAYLILTGTAKVFVEEASGSEVILAVLGPGDLVGELAVIDREARSASVVTLEPAELLWIARADLAEALRTMPQLSLNLLRLFARRLRLANAQVRALATLDVPGRVAR